MTRSAAIPRSWVLHVDLDQFIAAVEVLRHPELRGLPVVVGGDGDPAKRGVVATASYEARRYGVQSGLPLRTAARRCPEAVFLPVDRAAYETASAAVMAALREAGAATEPAAVVEVAGWDEAFLAVHTADPEGYARLVAGRVLAATRLAATVGIGENKLQAKLASGLGKPAGVFRLTRANWFAVLGGRPTDALWGIGAKTARRLAALGISTVAELAATDPGALAARLGPATGPWLVQTARGLGPSSVTAEPYRARGHGREETFQHDLRDWDEVARQVVRLAGLAARDVAAGTTAGQATTAPAGTTAGPRQVVRVVVKVRYAPFTTRTHGYRLDEPTVNAAIIQRAALAALGRFTSRRPVRLVGVRAEFAD